MLIGKKRKMTRVFHEKTGEVVPCTLIEIEPNVVSQIKTKETDGYTAVQVSAFALAAEQKKRLAKPQIGHFSKKSLNLFRQSLESRIADTEEFPLGKEVTVDYFSVGSLVDVRGKSKGKGYQGVIKRHGVARIVESHGAGPVVRHIGSSGFLTSHGRVHKGKKGAGHMGAKNVVTENLEIISILPEQNTLLVKGAIPGPNGGVVFVRQAIKKKNHNKGK